MKDIAPSPDEVHAQRLETCSRHWEQAAASGLTAAAPPPQCGRGLAPGSALAACGCPSSDSTPAPF